MINAIQNQYDFVEDRVKTPLSSVVGEVISDVIGQGKMNSLEMRNIEAPIQSETHKDFLKRRRAGCQSLIAMQTASLIAI